MNIAIVGTGYVGLVSGTCFADTGVNVTCVDVDAKKIERLNNGEIPIYEPGLDELVKKNVAAGRLKFTTDLASVLDDVEIVFSAVGTPPDEDGSADLKYVLQVAKTIGENLKKYVVVVTKSTVPVGTAKKVRKAIEDELKKRGVDIEFDVASNPEFLKEGNAIKDFMSPDRVVVGVESERRHPMNVIPRKNRNTRYSMQESVNRNLGLDRLRDPQKMPGFQELLKQQGVEQLLKSIIDARFDKMDITKEFLSQMESDDSPFDYGNQRFPVSLMPSPAAGSGIRRQEWHQAKNTWISY